MKKTAKNYGGLPAKYSSYRNSGIVILPVPFDKTGSWIRGSDKGPEAIIDASCHMELYDIDTNTEIYRKGIHTAKEVVSATSRDMVGKVRKKVRGFLKHEKFVCVLGGEHTVSLGSIQAHSEHYNDFSILHLDAHSDRRNSYEGNKYSHACVMARASEITENIVSVGIRSMDMSELEHIIPENMFYAPDILRSKNWIGKVLRRLHRDVYVTIDLDVFDPSIMPSTGTPEPGGMDWYEVLDLLGDVCAKKNIIGFDLVELCPSKNAAPDFLAAKLVYRLLSLKFAV